MSPFVKGFLLATLLFSVLGFAATLIANEDTKQLANDIVTDVVNTYCDVNVSYGWRRSGDTCSFDRVMTGFDGDYIYCSDVEVTCNL